MRLLDLTNFVRPSLSYYSLGKVKLNLLPDPMADTTQSLP